MSIQSEAAQQFQSDAIRRSDRVTAKVLRLWGRVSVDDLDGGWAAVEPEMVSAVSAVAVQNANSAGRMAAAVGRADGMHGDVIEPYAFAGVDGSGRTSGGLLVGAVTTTKEAVGAGRGVQQAFMAGAAYLAAMTKTIVADLSRSSILTASAGRSYTRYVRVVNPGACSRCAILAGSDRFSYHFERHPACKCTSVPVVGDDYPDGLILSPKEHFDGLSEAEQNRIYTKAGAEAIRLGADPIQVVGARRGASGMFYSRAYPAPITGGRRMQRIPIGVRPDGSQIMGYTTLEGTTRRGTYGRINRNLNEEFRRVGSERYSTTRRSRLMPESIIELTSDTDMRRTLLRDAGYLQPPTDYSSSTWVRDRLQQQQLDRIAADDFYRSIGVDLY